MSSKKKNSKEIFTFEVNDRRQSFRVQPTEENPILAKIDGKEIYLDNISAGGMGFQNDFKEPGSYSVSFWLPKTDISITIEFNVLKIDDNGICHCQFKDISNTNMEAIHKYVLAIQKEELEK